MDYITIGTLQKMRSAGFSYPDYEHFLNYGMVYRYNGEEYFIGGSSDGDFTDQDREAAEHGEWLPEASQLLSWLTDTDFSVEICVEDGAYFLIRATDKTDGTPYRGGGYTLANALARVIIKICKSNRRPYLPKSRQRLAIVE